MSAPAGSLRTPDVLKIMLRAADVLADLVRAARDGTAIDEARSLALADELRGLDPNGGTDEGEDDLTDMDFQPILVSFDDLDEVPVEAPIEAPSKQRFTIKFRPKPSLYAKANESALILRELGRLGEVNVTCDTSELPLLSELDPEGAYLTWTIKLETEHDEAAIREVFEFVAWDCDLDIVSDGIEAGAAGEAADLDSEVAALLARANLSFDESPSPGDDAPEPGQSEAEKPTAQPKAGKPNCETDKSAPQTIRVDLDRVDRLIDLVGELVINQAMLAQRVTEAGLARASAIVVGLDELEQLTREIQDSVMAIRAQPVKSVFQRMPRLVRELAAMTGKSVRLVSEGEATEVDKTVIERLTDPLTHMIRNAIDHGIEKPETRIAVGKPEEGVIRLSAAHRSGRIVIEITDDGAGIDRARVKQLAADKGLIAADAMLADEEIDNLIFLPGFSTASTVSDISGRGVGMDVVKRSIQALGGRISIASRPGRGSTFTMSLPLTLAVLDGMVVTVAQQTLVVPLTAIVETLQPRASEVHGMGGTARVMSIRNKFTALIDIGLELGYRAGPADPMTSVVILVESEGGGRSALLVDAIQGQRQVVIKSLEANYRHVPGIAAATILGDGRVALILDVDAVVASPRVDPTVYEPEFAAAG